jgi:uncharacterized protein YndB with AHSA1/START domain
MSSAINDSNELKISRIYDAPVKAVWEAWTDTEQVARWWGPRGFSITTHAKDLKVGGYWSYTMHGPDGVDYPNKTLYHEVEKFKRLVYDHGGSDDRPPLFQVCVEFEERGGRTHMEMTMTLASAELAREIAKHIKKAGGNATWDRLAEYLAKNLEGKEKFVINRSFSVSQEQMFEMWTNPDHFARWLPPTGFRMEFLRADLQKGGSTFYLMTNDAGVSMYGRAKYLEISKPDRIAYVQEFCDENENVSRHPFAPIWPEAMLTTVTLVDEGKGQTRVTITWEPHSVVNAEELAAFVSERGGMTQGWTGSFDKLEAYLLEGTLAKRMPSAPR